MQAYLDKTIPVVMLANASEGKLDYLQRDRDNLETHIYTTQLWGDRAFFWLGNSKLIIVSRPIVHSVYLQETIGYQGTRYLVPKEPTACLSLDVLREPDLIDELIQYAGPAKTLQLIPYVNTRQFFKLVDVLKTEYGFTLLLPESPDPEIIWLQEHIDTKAGFRNLISQWLIDSDPSWPQFPQGLVVNTLAQTAEVVLWFAKSSCACIVKSNNSIYGMGHQRFYPDECTSIEAIHSRLKTNPFLPGDTIAIEELIQSEQELSPSIELFVPPPGKGDPEITYMMNQLFLEFGQCSGVLLTKELQEENWYEPFAEVGLFIAEKFQSMGYVGHFDIDAIADDKSQLFLLESNPRRTATTHIHEFGKFFFGPNYLDEIVLLAQEMESGSIRSFDRLLEAIGDLQYPHYPANHERRGIIVTLASILEIGCFGYLIVATSMAEAIALQNQLKERIAAVQ